LKRLFLKTYGCQMNVHDAERMIGLMESDGYAVAPSPDEADVVVINTCAVREKPERKLMAELGHLKRVKTRNPGLIIGVAGCMAPRDGDLIRAKAPHVDLLLGPRSVARLPSLVRQIELNRQPLDAVDLFDDPTPLTPVRRSGTVSAWVDVQFGCSFACTFCAVPSARGSERSRPPGDILSEIVELATLGYREVTLLGQTVNAWGRDWHYRMPNAECGMINEEVGGRERIDFAWLLRQIDARAPGLRVRFTSPHPQLFSDRLIETIASLPALCEHVHLPLQSANDGILRAMKRAYSFDQYRRIVAKLRSAVPGIGITTDIIVGFPGESDAAFHETLDAFEELQFDQAFMFIYSLRRKTAAIDLPDPVPAEVARERMQQLVETANALFRRKNEAEVGRTFEVLVEGVSERNPDRLTGRTRQNKTVVFAGRKDLIGKLVKVTATAGFMWGFEGMQKSEGRM